MIIKELAIGAPLESNSSEALAKSAKKSHKIKKKNKKNHLKHDYKSFCGSGELEPIEKGESAGQIFNFFMVFFFAILK